MALSERLKVAPGSHQGRAAQWRSRLDVIADQLDPKERDLLLRALADPVGWPHTTLAKTLADEGFSCSYETVRKYRARRLWLERDDCPKDLR